MLMVAKTHDNFYAMHQRADSAETESEIGTAKQSTAPSNINNSIYGSKKRLKADYSRYLVGRSYQLFKRGIKTKMTLVFYDRMLYLFCSHVGMTTEEIVEKYGPYIKIEGK
ncbi:MAG: hypothetical protein ACREAY_09510, partial [Nitrososphaera sp.]|uniref:hypothetical protein n=1 Tax=Nitrososphaera sp. TaxID=1971748 RepID=UPI003D6FB429